MAGPSHPVPDLSRGLSPVTGPEPLVLILGSFPSVLSLTHSEYYGNPRNRFWAVMEELFGIPAALSYPERCLRLTQERDRALGCGCFLFPAGKCRQPDPGSGTQRYCRLYPGTPVRPARGPEREHGGPPLPPARGGPGHSFGYPAFHEPGECSGTVCREGPAVGDRKNDLRTELKERENLVTGPCGTLGRSRGRLHRTRRSLPQYTRQLQSSRSLLATRWGGLPAAPATIPPRARPRPSRS